MEQLHNENPSPLTDKLAGIRRIRYLLQTLGGVGLLFAFLVPFFFPISASIWDRFLHIAFFAFIPLIWLKLGISLRADRPESYISTTVGLWMTYVVAIIGEIIFVVLTGFYEMVTGSGSDPTSDMLAKRESISYAVLTFFNVVIMFIISRGIARFLFRKRKTASVSSSDEGDK